MADAAQFANELKRFVTEEVPKRAADVQRRMLAETLTLIVQATPVGNHTRWKANIKRAEKGQPPLPRGYVGGQARRNWQVSVGAPVRTPKPGVDASGQTAITEGFGVIAQIKDPTRAYISNPMPYMDRLENGWSKQAPKGMVSQAVAIVSAKYARVR